MREKERVDQSIDGIDQSLNIQQESRNPFLYITLREPRVCSSFTNTYLLVDTFLLTSQNVDLVRISYVSEILQILFIIFNLFPEPLLWISTLKIACERQTKGTLGNLMFFFEVIFLRIRWKNRFLNMDFICLLFIKREEFLHTPLNTFVKPCEGCCGTKLGVIQLFKANGKHSDKSFSDSRKECCRNEAWSRLLWKSRLLDQDH